MTNLSSSPRRHGKLKNLIDSGGMSWQEMLLFSFIGALIFAIIKTII